MGNWICFWVNRVGPKGAIALAEVLPKTKIKKLDLESNNICTEGAIALANCLPQTKIVVLELRGKFSYFFF